MSDIKIANPDFLYLCFHDNIFPSFYFQSVPVSSINGNNDTWVALIHKVEKVDNYELFKHQVGKALHKAKADCYVIYAF